MLGNGLHPVLLVLFDEMYRQFVEQLARQETVASLPGAPFVWRELSCNSMI